MRKKNEMVLYTASNTNLLRLKIKQILGFGFNEITILHPVVSLNITKNSERKHKATIWKL